MNQTTICLIIFLFTILGYVFYTKIKIPMGVIALASLTFLALTNCIDSKTALAGFSSPNTIMVIGIFILTMGFNRTSVIQKMTSLIYRVSGGSFTKILTGFVLLAAGLAQLVPAPMLVFAIVYPLAEAMCHTQNISPSKVMFPIGFASITSFGVFPMGPGASMLTTLNGYLSNAGSPFQLNVFDIFLVRFPVMVIMLTYMILVVSRFTPNEPIVALTSATGGRQKREPLTPFREKIAVTVFAVSTMGIIVQNYIPVEAWQIVVLGALIMVAFGVLSVKDVQMSLPLELICMYVGALTLSAALKMTGAGEIVGGWLSAMVGDVENGYVLGALFFMIPFALTQVMQNYSVQSIFVPIALIGCQALGMNPLGPVILVQAGAFAGFMTPMASGAVPLMMGAGGYDLKTLFRLGWIPACLIGFLSVLWTMTIFPAFP